MKRIAIALLSLAVVASCKKNEAPQTATTAPPPPAVTQTTATTSTAAAVPSAAASVVIKDAPVPTQGLVLWLRGDWGVTTDMSGKVLTWEVQGSSLKANAAKPEEQPTRAPNAIGGKTALHFDGNQNIMVADLNVNPDVMPQMTVISVFTSDTDKASPLRKLYGHDDGGYDRAAGLDDRSGDSKNYTIFTGNGVLGDFTLQANTPYLAVESYDDAAKKMNAWVNGAPTVQNGPCDHGKGLKQFYVGGTGTSYHEPWMGNVGEIMVYSRTLTDDERKKVEDYLAAKYGLKLTR